jgi:hypothetical protein
LFFEENQKLWRIDPYKADYQLDSCGDKKLRYHKQQREI